MNNTYTNFDIDERVRKSVFIDRNGDWTSFTNGMGSMAEQLGCYIPEFLIFVEIYNLDGELILNYPVEQTTEADLEEAMKRQVLLYGKLIENVGVCTVALETSLVESAEWFAFERFKAPEFLVVEVLERAERYTESSNNQLSYLDLITNAENDEAGIEIPVAPLKDPPRPALRENPAQYQTIAIPVVVRAKSVRINPSDHDPEDEVDAATVVTSSDADAAPSTQDGPAAGLHIRNEYSTVAEIFAKAPRRILPALRKLTGIIYAVLSWLLLVLSIWSIGKGSDR